MLIFFICNLWVSQLPSQYLHLLLILVVIHTQYYHSNQQYGADHWQNNHQCLTSAWHSWLLGTKRSLLFVKWVAVLFTAAKWVLTLSICITSNQIATVESGDCSELLSGILIKHVASWSIALGVRLGVKLAHAIVTLGGVAWGVHLTEDFRTSLICGDSDRGLIYLVKNEDFGLGVASWLAL